MWGGENGNSVGYKAVVLKKLDVSGMGVL